MVIFPGRIVIHDQGALFGQLPMAKAHWLVLPDLLAWQPFSGTEHNRPVDVGEQPLPVLPHDGVAFAIRAEAYAVQPSVSPPNPSGNPKLNPCKLWGFSERNADSIYMGVAIPPTTEAVGFLATGW